MSPPINYLRIYRKRSPLTQADIAFLMKLSDYSNISRYEKGQRAASIEFLLTYYLLFAASIESFFEPQSEIIRSSLQERIGALVVDLKKENDSNNDTRIKFLEEVLIRLTNWITYEYKKQSSVCRLP